jgi:hypothetical protein
VRNFVTTLPVTGTTSSGDIQVKLPNGRHVARSSAERILERKFPKHQAEIAQRVNGQTQGRAMAQEHISAALNCDLGNVAARIAKLAPQAALSVPASNLVRLRHGSLADAVDAFILTSFELIRRGRKS